MNIKNPKWKFVATAAVIFAVALIIGIFDFFKCQFIILGPVPYFCYQGVYPLTKVFGMGFYIISIINWLFFGYNNAARFIATLLLIFTLIFEIGYTFLLAYIYINRDKIKSKISSTKLFLLTFFFVYVAWIFIYNVPYDLMASYGLGNYVIETSGNNIVTGFNPITNMIYTLIWPFAGFFRSDSDIAYSITILLTSIIELIAVTSVIYFAVFGRNSQKEK